MGEKSWMGKYTSLISSLVMSFFLVTPQALAAQAFTSEVIHTHPGQSPRVGKLFVSDQGSRFEFEHNGKLSVQVFLPILGVVRLLFPQSKTYVETMQSPLHPAMDQLLTPCPPLPVAHCERAGMETLNGQKIEVWHVNFEPMSDQESSTPFQIWWDAERKLAVREQYPDGRTSTAVLLGQVTHQNRQVEHWQVTLAGLEGKTTQITNLYDPELQMNVREEHPNGSVRELRDIRLVLPDPAWFDVPTGYQRLDPQQAESEG